jgi:cell cycle checkpoint control protein RAD9A
VQHAVFDRARSRNLWTIESRFLREIIDHFSPSAEQLDIYPDGGKAVFTSFTAKVTDGKGNLDLFLIFFFLLLANISYLEILKQPVHTSVAIDTNDFEEFMVQDGLHVAVNVKDFKAAVIHADTVKTSITARYTRPCRPLQLAYESEGITCEFTLMTRGDVDDNEDNTPNASQPRSQLSARPAVQPVPVKSSKNTADSDRMPPPRSRSVQLSAQAAAPSRPEIPSSAAPRSSAYVDFDSIFVPADDDKQWDEHTYEEDTLGWDVNAATVCLSFFP